MQYVLGPDCWCICCKWICTLIVVLALWEREVNIYYVRLTGWSHVEHISLLRPGTGAEYCDELVCLSVCPSVCMYISETIRPNITKFWVHVARGRHQSSTGRVATRYVLPVLWILSYGMTTTAALLHCCELTNTPAAWFWLCPVLEDGRHQDQTSPLCMGCRDGRCDVLVPCYSSNKLVTCNNINVMFCYSDSWWTQMDEWLSVCFYY